MCFSHMLWSPWYAGYEVMTLLVMLMRCIAVPFVALGCICLWMAFFCKNDIWSSLVSWMPLMFKLCTYGYILLNLCLEPCSFHLGSKTHFSSWMFSLHATLWRSLSFFCCKGTSCTMLNCKSWNRYMKCLCFNNMLPCWICFKFLILGVKPLHDAHQWEVSYLEVDAWLGGFNMTWHSL
jgi:hypothetical protein